MIFITNVNTPNKEKFCLVGPIQAPCPPELEPIKGKINDRINFLKSAGLGEGIYVSSTLVEQGFVVTFKVKHVSAEHVGAFLGTYASELYKSYHESEIHYAHNFEQTHQRMREAILDGSFLKDTKAIKSTCKRMGIKHTYKAINQYLKDGTV